MVAQDCLNWSCRVWFQCLAPRPKKRRIRGQKLNMNFFSQTFRALPGYPGKIPRYPRQKSLISLVSRDISNFLAPTPSRGRPLPHRKISGLKSLGLCSFFVAPIFFGKEKFCSGAGRCMLSFSQTCHGGSRLPELEL